MSPAPNIPSPIEVTTWPQVVALACFLAAFVVVPAVIGYLQLRATKSAQAVATIARDTAIDASGAAHKTLAAVTKNNGGKSMPDRFDQQDRYFAEIFDRLDKLDGVPRAVSVTVHPTPVDEENH